MWTKLIDLIPEEIDFFQLVKRKIAKTLGEDKTAVLLQELYNKYKTLAASDPKKWDIAIALLKEILHIDNSDIWARREIAETYLKPSTTLKNILPLTKRAMFTTKPGA